MGLSDGQVKYANKRNYLIIIIFFLPYAINCESEPTKVKVRRFQS